jgi:hypothetical protein
MKPERRKRSRNSFRKDPAWWAWAIVALMALVPVASVLAQLDHPASAVGAATVSFSAHG